MENFKTGVDALFIMTGAIMVLAMHAGFAFLELGTVRKKNQVNALVKILIDFAVSTIAYFFIGYSIAYGVNFFASAEVLAQKNGFELVKFFFNVFRHSTNGLKVTWTCCRKSCLNNVNTKFFKLSCNAQFLFLGHRSSRALFSIP